MGYDKAKYACCRDAANHEISRASDEEIVRTCRVCGRRHFEVNLEPGNFSVVGKAMAAVLFALALACAFPLPASALGTDQSEVAFAFLPNDPAPADQDVQITSTGSWTWSDSIPCIMASPTGGTGNGTVTISITDTQASCYVSGAIATVSDDTGAPNVTVTINLGTPEDAAYLSWTANSEQDLAGYRVKEGSQSGGPYTQIADQTATTLLVTGRTGFNCWVLTAYDTSGNESAASPEACKDGPVDTTAPAVPVGLAAH